MKNGHRDQHHAADAASDSETPPPAGQLDPRVAAVSQSSRLIATCRRRSLSPSRARRWLFRLRAKSPASPGARPPPGIMIRARPRASVSPDSTRARTTAEQPPQGPRPSQLEQRDNGRGAGLWGPSWRPCQRPARARGPRAPRHRHGGGDPTWQAQGQQMGLKRRTNVAVTGSAPGATARGLPCCAAARSHRGRSAQAPSPSEAQPGKDGFTIEWR